MSFSSRLKQIARSVLEALWRNDRIALALENNSDKSWFSDAESTLLFFFLDHRTIIERNLCTQRVTS